jgi:hypothetical protein
MPTICQVSMNKTVNSLLFLAWQVVFEKISEKQPATLAHSFRIDEMLIKIAGQIPTGTSAQMMTATSNGTQSGGCCRTPIRIRRKLR